MATVELSGVGKSYGKQRIIAGLDLSIADGEMIVLVGPSGCGKSTILRMIAGLERLSAGTLKIGGRVVNSMSPKERGVAMVFQNYALYPHMTVRQNLGFALELAKQPQEEIDARVAEAAKLLHIEALLEKKPGHLSGGQKQRVAMGRALVRRPAVFLFDEPLSNLDAQLRVRMRTEIAELHRRLKATMIYVTHDQIEAMTLATRMVVLRDGVVEQEGPPLKVFRQPKTRFVASFIGTPGMNFLPVGALAPVIRERSHPPAGSTLAGFRPEDTQVVGKGMTSGGQASLGKGRIRLVEPLGALAHVHVDLGGDHQIIAEARTSANLSIDQEVEVRLSPKRLYFFGGDDVCLEWPEAES